MKNNLPKSEEDIFGILRNCKIVPGDTLLLHSNITKWTISLLKSDNKKPLQLILDSLINFLGKEGTLLLPTFNFDFSNFGYYDYLKTPSQMGSLSQESLKRKNFTRTKHPIYSFAVHGYHSKLFINLQNIGATSSDSPFALIRKLNGKIGIIDLSDQDSMTFYHYVEDYLSVPYRYNKIFNGKYINENGNEVFSSYSLNVRNLDEGIETFLYSAEEMLWENKFYVGEKPLSGAGLRVIDCQVFCEFVEKFIDSPENKLYKINKKN